MDTNPLQTLIDGYMKGDLNSANQAEFDSRFASDPAFSEKVTQSLASHVGEPPVDFVDGIASRLDTRWESLYKKTPSAVDRTLFVETGVLVAALAVLVGAGWYVWKTLGTSASQAMASSPQVVLAFTLPSTEAVSWKPKMTFTDAERDFTPRAAARSTNENMSVANSPSLESSTIAHSNAVPGASQIGQILRIRVEVPRDLEGRVTLWDSQGQMVRHLFEGAMPKGTWALDWDQKNDKGLLVQPGSYSVHIEAGGQTLTGQVFVAPGS